MKYDCGCVNELDEASGLTKSVSKCPFHLDHQFSDCDFAYYKELNCFDANGIPQNKGYIAEFLTALNELKNRPHELPCFALEIGCGPGMYVPLFLKWGWHYEGLDRSGFACDWIRNTFDVTSHFTTWEDFRTEHPYDVIFAAHAFEHMRDAPAMLRKAYELGNELWLILPDDQDPVNPDHLWFFNQRTLHAFLEKIGYRNVRSIVRRIVKQEKFIYCVAEK